MLLWLVLSGYFDAFFVSMGMISSVLSVVMRNALKGTISVESHGIRSWGIITIVKAFRYCLWLAWQVAISTTYVTKKILGVRCEPCKPVIAVMNINQKSDVGLFMLANSITVTPGTVGMKTYAGGKIRVLALNSELLSGVADMDEKISGVLEETT
ncbi:MAG: Na+/H+ antiporter subunit E [Aaplasma endosymbiont of Hyalomma asiaticum]